MSELVRAREANRLQGRPEPAPNRTLLRLETGSPGIVIGSSERLAYSSCGTRTSQATRANA